MAIPQLLAVSAFALALAHIQLVTCDVLKGLVSCFDCSHSYDFSGIKVLIKCDEVKKLATAVTQKNGAFEAKLPLEEVETSPADAQPNCLAKLLGGPNQLYISRKAMVSKVVKTQGSNAYAISAPLTFANSCSTFGKISKCRQLNTEFGSSKTVNLPVPPEYGLPPTSFYAPFIPIIGVP